MCETITNCVISISSDEFINPSACSSQDQLEFNEWFHAIKTRYSTTKLNSPSKEKIVEESQILLRDENNNNMITSTTKSFSLVNEFTLNSARRASYTTTNKLNLYACIWSNCSYTIQVTEHMMGNDKQAHFLDIADKQATLIASLIKHSAAYTNLNRGDIFLESITCDLLAQFFTTGDEIGLYEIDMFHLLVSLNFSRIGYLFDRAHEAHVFRFMLQAHCIQGLVNSLAKAGEVACKATCEENDVGFVTDETLGGLIRAVCDESQQQLRLNDDLDFLRVGLALKEALVQFLQCSAIYYSSLYGLTKKMCEIERSVNNYKKLVGLVEFFGLDLNECLSIDSESVSFLVKRMVKSLPKNPVVAGSKIDIPVEFNKFVTLPDDYLDLISMCTALNNSEYLNVMCLVCGEMLKKETHVLDEKIVGACTAHAHKCCLNSGMFLKIDECKVLMLQIKFTASGKLCEVTGCYVSAPYLDDYGETDQDFL